jgi:Fur family peroxide stress response transcriptional regulator
MKLERKNLRTPQTRHPGPDLAEHLRSRGIRVTAQRLAVFRALAEDESHPTAEAVLARVSSHTPMAPSTVYRILESFEAEKLIRRVSTTGDIVRFDANLVPHQHLVCRVCGRMTDHFGPALAAAPMPAETVDGFVVEELDIRLVGRCEACRAAASKTDPHRVSKPRRRP